MSYVFGRLTCSNRVRAQTAYEHAPCAQARPPFSSTRVGVGRVFKQEKATARAWLWTWG